MAFAGLWDTRRDRSLGEPADARVRSCTIIIITTTTGDDRNGIHDRMPVVLEPEVLAVWLHTIAQPDELMALLRPGPAGTLSHHPVDPRAGNVRDDDPQVIAPYDPGAVPTHALVQPSLFTPLT